MSEAIRIDRRTTIKWMMAAAATLPAMPRHVSGEPATSTTAQPTAAKGYGSDPDLMQVYAPGDLWPLTFTADERRIVASLCDLIIPADAKSPAASAVGVVDFLDEWISAPYPEHQTDRPMILAGIEWLDAEAHRRFGSGFADIESMQMTAICDEICRLQKAAPQLTVPATFFARFRDLTVGGFYTTPDGMRDLDYVGNVALARFDGPPTEVLRRVGLSEEPA
jgi:hypothetical protein